VYFSAKPLAEKKSKGKNYDCRRVRQAFFLIGPSVSFSAFFFLSCCLSFILSMDLARHGEEKNKNKKLTKKGKHSLASRARVLN